MNVRIESSHSEGPWQGEEMAQRNSMKFSRRGENCHRLGADTLCSPGGTHQECWASPAFPSARETLSILEQIQQRATTLLRD